LVGWYFSVVIISNIDIEVVTQKGLFSRSVMNVAYENMTNIMYETKGFLQAIFNFGAVNIQTQMGEIKIDYLGSVARKHKIITDNYNKREI
jgi:Bacterial PH domain